MKFFRKVRSFFRREELERDMAEEMRLHLELQTEKNLAAGMSADEARYAARRQFGGIEQVKERCREQRPWVGLELAWKEVGFAIRSLRRAPGFSVAVLVTLALCIGPNTAILSALYTLVYKPLPFREAQQLVVVANVAERLGGSRRQSSVAQSEDFAAHADRFQAFSYFSSGTSTIGGEEGPVRVSGIWASANIFSVLGVRMQLGRSFSAEEQTVGHGHVVVLSDLAWRTRHNADPTIVGREIRMDSETYTVIGVASRSFEEIFNDVEFFRPRTLQPYETDPTARYSGAVQLVGRLKPGVTLEAARAQLAVLEATFLSTASPQMRLGIQSAGLRIDVSDARQTLAEPIKTPLLLLQGGAALVLLIGCVNVASLLVARLSAKRPELAIRHALGAGGATLLRQMLAESFLLVGGAGILGITVALGMLAFMNHYLSTVVRHVPPIRLDSHVLGIVFGVVLVLILVMGTVPFALLWRSGLRPGETSQASTSRRGRQAVSALVIAQMALALVLLIGAGLLIHSFARVMAVRPGFDAAQIVHARINIPFVRYKEAKDNLTLQQRVLEAVKSIPGVQAVSLSADFPVRDRFNPVPFRVRDDVNASEAERLVNTNVVSPDFFSTMGIALRDGRGFRDDDSRQVPVVIVDDTFGPRFFPGRNVVGMELNLGLSAPAAGKPWARVVGVVARAHLSGLEGRDGWPFVYLPFNQNPTLAFSLMVRSSRLKADLVSEMRTRIRAIDPELPLSAVGTLASSLDALLGNRRALMFLLGVFATLALSLSAVGLYGVLNYDVAQRTREIGIRGAIGATQAQIVAMILRQGLGKALLGLGAGLIGAFGLTRVLRKMLFDVSPTDPTAYGLVAALLLLVALVASWLPARRAAKVDPIVALRCE